MTKEQENRVLRALRDGELLIKRWHDKLHKTEKDPLCRDIEPYLKGLQQLIAEVDRKP